MTTGENEFWGAPPAGRQIGDGEGGAHTLSEAARHWDAYYQGDRYRRKWHIDQPSPELMCLLAAGVVSPCRALDVGCGAGTEAVWLARTGFQVTALDVSGDALPMTRRLAARNGVKVSTVQAFAHETGLPDHGFDFINDRSCFHVIEPKLAMFTAYAREVARLLSPRGVLFLRRLGGEHVDLSTFERVFRDDFDLGRIQETKFHEPHMPSRVAVLRRRP